MGATAALQVHALALIGLEPCFHSASTQDSSRLGKRRQTRPLVLPLAARRGRRDRASRDATDARPWA